MASFITVPALNDVVIVNIEQIIHVAKNNAGCTIHTTAPATGADNRTQHLKVSTTLDLDGVTDLIRRAGGSVVY